ncbi:MAG: SH3 domain-containing protein [Terriglobales bacterium]
MLHSAAAILCAASAISLVGCKHSGGRVLEIAYVSGVQVNLRDRVAAVYERAGIVKNGERVEVLDHDRTFVKVRTAAGQMGWMEKRYLVRQQVFDQLQRLTADNQNDPIQAQAVTRNDTNLHVEPGRETEHLYQILAGEKLLLLKRGMAEKPGSVAMLARTVTSAEKPGEKGTKQIDENPGEKKEAASGPHPAIPHPAIEDWWLVRDSHGRAGWVLGRMVDLDVPLEVAQYAEGQRIVAFFVLNEVQDGDKKVPQYLTVLTEPKDGLPFDFNQFRVFTWNVKRHRYETAYRERIEGMLPVTVAPEDFGKEGVLPVFVVRVLDEAGKVSERKYKLNTPIVRRVYAPGEEPAHATPKAAGRRSRRRKR